MEKVNSATFLQALDDQLNIRLFDECIPRIKKCLAQLTSEQIWWRPNEASNSIGNLILHLDGNVRQWILSGIFGRTDIRKRALEFNQRAHLPANKLSLLLDELQSDVQSAMLSLSAEHLLEKRIVQNIFDETPVSILIHVIEHFSYHTGQIAYITKMINGEPLAFYDESKL